VLVPGVKDTPRSTSPYPADRTVTNCSPAGSAAADSLSVIATNLFGSAPWVAGRVAGHAVRLAKVQPVLSV
jgi:hypothetical protein